MHLTEQNLLGRLAVLQAESAAALVEEVSALVEELNPLHAANQIQLALDRLAQALQVAMATGALLCSRGEWEGLGVRETGLGVPRALTPLLLFSAEDLRTLCSRLPHNK